MKKTRKLPLLNVLDFTNTENRIEKEIFSRWNKDIKNTDDDPKTITIYEEIGQNFWGEGFSAKKMASLLKDAGKKDIVVSINSPGGSFFEGATIYNMLMEHPGKVTVKIPGMAASAAAIIAMAGDEILVSEIGFIMVHNVWGCMCGDKNDFRKTADDFDIFDGALADVFESRTGLSRDEIIEMLDKETWLSGKAAVEKGFADNLIPAKKVKEDNSKNKTKAAARRTIEAALGKEGLSRKERETILKAAIGEREATPGIAGDPDAINSKLEELLNVMRKP